MGSCISSNENAENHFPPPPHTEQCLQQSHSHNIKPVETEKLQSFVECQLYDDVNPPECSYCGKPNSDKADMIICKSPTIPYEQFQKLMVRGWWRTGNVFFRPQVEKICCPSYAIRLPVEEYQLSKSHRRVLAKWKEFLLNGDPRWEDRKTQFLSVKDTGRQRDNHTSSSSGNGLPSNTLNGSIVTEICQQQGINASFPQQKFEEKRTKKPPCKGIGPDPGKPPCKKAKERRADKKLAKQHQLQQQQQRKQSEGSSGAKEHSVEKKSLLKFLEEHERELESSDSKHKLEVKLISQNDPEMVHTMAEFFDLYNRFQDAVHPGKSKFKTPADLHWGFIDSPLEPQEEENSRPLGTYHMRYYLDGELMMLSVIDILPEYFVSIYFIYDPNIRFLQPGIYTCLREIALIQKLQKSHPELRYYNLGFYNDFSPKINYKRQFKPTEILCPITGTYVPLEDTIPLLKLNRFCRFAKDGVPDRPEVSDSDLDNLIVLSRDGFDSVPGYVYFHQLPSSTRSILKPALRQYLREVGDDVMKEMLLSQ